MPQRYSIHLFGKPLVSDEAGAPVSGLSPGKPLALLSYLLVQGETPREEVVALLWGDIPETKARNAFRQALHRLRSALGEDAIPHTADALLVAPELAVGSDVRSFERLLEAGQLEKAIEFYSGDFLSGLDVGEEAFDEWRDSTRKRYRAKFRDALRTLIQADIDSGEITRALRRAGTLASTDAADVEAATLHASTLLGAGRRAEAQQVLEEFARRYQQDFNTAAPAGVRDFLSRLRRTRDEHRENTAVRHPLKFVGREKELSLLLARLRSLESGGGSLVIIGGGEGIGKTRLIDEFLIRARDLGSVLLLQGRERSPGSGIAYASVGEALRGVLDAPGIAGTGQHLLAEAARLLPQLRDQFSLPAIADISDDASRLRFYEGIAALLDSVAYEQPVCIALDDFHNCSATTFGLVEYLAERLSAAPILFLIAGRATPEFAALGEELRVTLLRSASARNERAPAHINLGALDHQAAIDLIEAVVADAALNLPPDDIIAATEGVPYRIIEACERIRAGEEGSKAPIRIRDVLWARLKRSTQAEQRMFVTVALFDRPVSIRLLAAASHIPEKSALDATLALERDGLLHQSPEGVAPAHDFSGELALEGTGPAGRALLAGWAGDALAHDGSGTNAELAGLFVIGGRRKEAFSYARSAALDAMRAGATIEAKHHLGIAIGTAPTQIEREQAEMLLRSLSGGGFLLAAGDGQAPPAAAVETVPGASAKPSVDPDRQERTENDWRVTKRKWTLGSALGAAAALAVIALLGLRLFAHFSASIVPGTSLADSLIVARELDPRDTVIAFATGQLGSPLQDLEGATRHGPTRTWIDSLRLPWANPLPSPDGRNVAIERIARNGSELYVISRDRRDTIPLRTGEGDNFSSGWSPDGRWLLATHGETRGDGTYSAQLFAYSIFRGGPRIAFDTARSSSVVEAVWSPDGTHVAWTSRVGPEHQQEVFVSDADGQNAENVSNSAAEDYSIAWSPDGSILAFTSERSGRADLYSVDLNTRQMRRLTWEGAHADHALFSRDGRWLAYESTKGGTPAVYVMPSGGGTGRSVAPDSARVTLVGWRGRKIPYLDQLIIGAPQLFKPGDAGSLVVHALDQKGELVRPRSLRAEVLAPRLIQVEKRAQPHVDGSLIDSIALRGISRGLARVSVSAGGWRTDTAFVAIGDDTLSLLSDGFERGLLPEVWRTLGAPMPAVQRGVGARGSSGLVAHSGREWESGVLSQTVFPIRRGLTTDVWVKAPFAKPADAARSFVIALVAADPAEAIDSVAPKFLRLVTVSWVGEAGRLSYGVGREIFTEPSSALDPSEYHRITITILEDDRVSISIDGVERWRSSLRVRTQGDNSRGQIWLGSKASVTGVVFDDVTVRLVPHK